MSPLLPYGEADQSGGCACIAGGGLGDLEYRTVRTGTRRRTSVVPNRSPLASAIRLPSGYSPLLPVEADQDCGGARVARGSKVPLLTISNTVPSPLAPPFSVVPNRSPLASAIRLPCGSASVAAAVEAGQRCGGARVARGSNGAVVDDLEHRAVPVRAAALRRAEQVAVGVGDQAAGRRRCRSLPLKLTRVVGVLA